MAERVSVGWRVGGLGQKRELTQTTNRQAGRKLVPEGLEIYYYSRFKQQRLVGNSGCGRGEWNRGGVELPKSDNGPGPVPWKSCAGFVCFRFVGGSKRSRCCTAFFPADTHRDNFCTCSSVLYRFYCLLQLCKWQRDAEVRGQRDRRWICACTRSLIPWRALVIHDIHLPCGNMCAVALIPLVRRSLRLLFGCLAACMRSQLLRLSLVPRQAHELACKVYLDQHAQNTDQVCMAAWVDAWAEARGRLSQDGHECNPGIHSRG